MKNQKIRSMKVHEQSGYNYKASARFEAMATPLFQYKNFVFMWGGSYGKEHRCAYLLTPYLASINNLSSAVVKNTDKTMKITYTLTEETM